MLSVALSTATTLKAITKRCSERTAKPIETTRKCATPIVSMPIFCYDIPDLAFSALIGYTTITIDSIYFAANSIGGMYG
jgi:hypothetical protein